MGIKDVLRKIRLVNIILELTKKEPNDYTLGQKIRQVVDLYKSKKKIDKQEILESNTKN